MVRVSGIIYGARDDAHKRMIEALQRGKPLPIPVEGQVIYYVAPAPAKPGDTLLVLRDPPPAAEWPHIPFHCWSGELKDSLAKDIAVRR